MEAVGAARNRAQAKRRKACEPWVSQPPVAKASGGQRGLGIPNVVDRIVQQAVHQVLSPHYEQVFHDSSHGFRPGRSCHTAIKQAKKYLEDGCDWVVDIDLEKFFDRVNHDRLMSRLEQSITDRRVLVLIRQMLRAGVVMPDGVVVASEEGTPQGHLSPLLSNIVLDELDHELERRGHRFVRYADDCNIYVAEVKAVEERGPARPARSQGCSVQQRPSPTSSTRRAGCEAHKSGSVRGAPGKPGVPTRRGDTCRRRSR
jgi:group II intron reverse transcriptase/maturase